MDREIEFQQLNSRRRRNWGKCIAYFLLFLGLIWMLRILIRPQASAKDFRMANIEQGVLENTISASGLVTPSYEHQINAPIATEIKNVELRSGTQVNPGDLIMELDKTFIRLEVAGRKSKLDLSRNAIDLLKLELDRDLKELEYDDQIKGLEVAAARAALADAQRLVKVGGATAEEAEQAQTRLQILELEKSKLENELNYRRQSLAGRQREVVLAANVEEQQLRELESKLSLTEVRATSRGVITWVPLVVGLSICGFLIINVALGLFGVLYYNISKRRSEIGLRRAIGSSQGEIRKQFTIEVFLVSLFGMILAAVLAVQFPLLEVVDIPADNFYLSIAFTAGLISIVVLLCALWPSHQAAQIHPAIALHEE